MLIKLITSFLILFSSIYSFAESFQSPIAGMDTSYSFDGSDSRLDLYSEEGRSLEIEHIALNVTRIGVAIALANSELEEDKVKHVIAGAMVSALAAQWCESRNFDTRFSNEQIRILCGIGASALVGVAKEIYDSTGRGNVEAADIEATVYGSLLEVLFFEMQF